VHNFFFQPEVGVELPEDCWRQKEGDDDAMDTREERRRDPRHREARERKGA